jgi:ankyrin repeat protein
MTGLHWAASRSHEQLVDLLLSYYSDPTQYDQLGRTALYYAVRNNSYRIIKKLLIARSLPHDDYFDMDTLSEDYLTKKLIQKAKFVIFTLKMIPPKNKYNAWSLCIQKWLEPLTLPNS